MQHLYLKTQQRHGCAVKSIIFIFLIHSIHLPNIGLHTGTQMHSASLANSIIKQAASRVYRQAEKRVSHLNSLPSPEC